jgi:hypothetical protein
MAQQLKRRIRNGAHGDPARLRRTVDLDDPLGPTLSEVLPELSRRSRPRRDGTHLRRQTHGMINELAKKERCPDEKVSALEGATDPRRRKPAEMHHVYAEGSRQQHTEQEAKDMVGWHENHEPAGIGEAARMARDLTPESPASMPVPGWSA